MNKMGGENVAESTEKDQTFPIFRKFLQKMGKIGRFRYFGGYCEEHANAYGNLQSGHRRFVHLGSAGPPGRRKSARNGHLPD